MQGQLAARLAEIDAARFVGRRSELALLEGMLTDERDERVATVHGPGGIGKSSLLRTVARTAAEQGFAIRWIDARDVSPGPEALEDALSGLRDAGRTLLVVDGYERIAALGGYLRHVLLSDLSDRSRAIVAGREPREEAWQASGWETLVVDVRLDPLDEEDAIELLRRHGIEDPRAAREIVKWAGGSPLALTLAAEAEPAGDGEPAGPDVLEALLRALTGRGLEGMHMLTLAIAALARVTTCELLRDALPSTDAAAEYQWLAARTYSEPLGEGLGLHELVRRAARAELHRRYPELERTLCPPIADHLHRRAVTEGRLDLSIDLAGLVRSGAIRWGYSWEAGSRYWIDDVRPGDPEEIRRRLAGTRHEPAWSGSERFMTDAPEHVAIVRDRRGRLAGYAVALAPGAAPDCCAADPILGPRLAHARANGRDDDAVLWRDCVDLSATPGSGVIGLLGIAGVLRSTRENPRFAYLPINPALAQARAFAAALRAEHLPELDVDLDGERIECHVVDYGPGGLLAAQCELVYHELGLTPPARPVEHDAIGVDAVRQALRAFGSPQALAGCALAHGETVDERAAAARQLIEEGVRRGFGSGQRDSLMREVLARAYLDPAASHELAAEQLHLSRSTYFRHLKAATERLTDTLAQTPRGETHLTPA